MINVPLINKKFEVEEHRPDALRSTFCHYMQSQKKLLFSNHEDFMMKPNNLKSVGKRGAIFLIKIGSWLVLQSYLSRFMNQLSYKSNLQKFTINDIAPHRIQYGVLEEMQQILFNLISP